MYNRSNVYYNEALKLYCGEMCNPRLAIIYVVYGCNFSCHGCLCSKFNTEKKYMDFELFKDLTLQLKQQGVKSIEFCGGGEPLLHPDICKMITWITDCLHLSFGVMSNGSMLNEHLDYILATRANYVRISLYNNSYQNVMKKVERLIEIKKEVDGDTVIGVKFLADPFNQNSTLERVKETALNPGINHISVKAKRDEGEVIDYSDLQEKINNIQNKKISANLEKTYLKGKCWMSPIHTLIDPMGNVYICCYYMNREKEHCIGNIKEKKFAEIWGSQEHINKLNNIDCKKCNVYDCRWHKYNEDMYNLLQNNTHHQFC